LCITWLNRILFLKLLESQIIAHHKGDEGKRFLTTLKIQDFDSLYELFFDVLAKSPESREQNTRDYFGEIPYLNSSLFEKTELEVFTISINQIRNRLSIPYFSQSVLKDVNGKRSLSGQTPTLSYLLDFLNAYNFGSNDTGDIIQDRPKDLISASVLGLIFEKLNGYKDGSFFTPSFITMYMCSQSIRKAVVQKFNDSEGDIKFKFIPVGGFKDFKDLAQRLDYQHTKIREEANTLINNIRICDPAVGSGHFLVSALNELIQIKYDLKILSYRHNQERVNRDWKINIDNDELRITPSDSRDTFIYNPQNEDHHNLQETLFHEKQTLIENCLFGVDINPKSVSICRLRLWIELLKNAYYKPTTNQLQVLPNIDINIKIGNSLVSRFGMNSIESYTKSLKNREIIQEISQKYAEQVKRYKNNTNSDLKGEIKDEIKSLKEAFSRFVQNTDKDYLKMKRKESELKLINDNPHYTGSLELQFSEDTPEQKKTNLTKKTKKIESEFKELNKIWQHKLDTVYKYAFEWRYEFPEVFDTKGDFVGFDVVVGNPPYIRQEKLSMEQKMLWLTSFPEVSNSTADIYVYFFGLGQRILKNKGFLSFITLNKWLKTKYGDALRTHLSNYKVETIIDFFELNVFEEASTDSAITFFQNELVQDDFTSKYFPIKTLKELNLKQIVLGNSFLEIEKKKAEWKFVSIKNQTILRKFEENTIPLKNYVSEKMYMGIKTAANEVFIISDELKEELCSKDPKSIEIIRPYLRPTEFGRYCYEGKKEWFINSHNGIVLNRNIITHRFKKENEIEYYMPDENTKIEVFRKEQVGTTIFRINRVDVENDYPAIFEYMNTHFSKLQNREDKGKHWTNLRNCDYIYEFDKPKIAYVYTAKRHNFYLDYDKRLINNSSYMIVSEDKYLLAFLNSKLFEWYKKIKFVAFGDAEEGGRVKLDLNKMETVPIKQVGSEAKTTFIDKIDSILSLKAIDPANDTKELESEIDELIFDLYDLSTEERNSVRGI
jgi:adenine-specific DNA-methyltransferase